MVEPDFVVTEGLLWLIGIGAVVVTVTVIEIETVEPEVFVDEGILLLSCSYKVNSSGFSHYNFFPLVTLL